MRGDLGVDSSSGEEFELGQDGKESDARLPQQAEEARLGQSFCKALPMGSPSRIRKGT
jgi:hypothetical protein